MSEFVTRQEMEAEAPGVYATIASQFRDRLPSNVFASPQNAQIFRTGFNVMPGLADELFSRLKYVEGTKWPMWKLVAAFYLVEARIGPNSALHAGEKIYSTMPWPPHVTSVADALRFTDTAYFESHLRSPREIAGCWRVELMEPTRLVLVDDTPYPYSVQDGVVAGICRAFARQAPVYEVVDEQSSKRHGGTLTRYEVTFLPAKT